MTDDVDVGLQGSAEIKPERFSPLVSPPASSTNGSDVKDTLQTHDHDIGDIERGLAELQAVTAQLEPLVNPIVEAQQEVAESKAAVAEAQAAAAEIERLRTEEIERERAADEQRQTEAQTEESRRAQWQQFATEEDARFHSAYGDLDPNTQTGPVEMLRANLPEEVIQAAWNGEGGIPLRSAFMQSVLVDAWRYRNQPKAVPMPRQQPKQQEPRGDDGQSPLTARSAARLLAMRGRK